MTAAAPPRGFSYRKFTIDLVSGCVNTSEAIPGALRGAQIYWLSGLG